jgi:hypothetical protein
MGYYRTNSPITGRENILSIEQIGVRMAYIVDEISDSGSMQELSELARVCSEVGNGDATLINEDYTAEYHKQEFSEIHPSMDLDFSALAYIDWDAYSDSQCEALSEVELFGTTYLYDA